jgi:hypothetical protein
MDAEAYYDAPNTFYIVEEGGEAVPWRRNDQ